MKNQHIGVANQVIIDIVIFKYIKFYLLLTKIKRRKSNWQKETDEVNQVITCY